MPKLQFLRKQEYYLGDLYWTFYKDGRKFYTTGISAGKEVYFASKKTRKKIKEVAKERLGEAISKL